LNAPYTPNIRAMVKIPITSLFFIEKSMFYLASFLKRLIFSHELAVISGIIAMIAPMLKWIG